MHTSLLDLLFPATGFATAAILLFGSPELQWAAGLLVLCSSTLYIPAMRIWARRVGRNSALNALRGADLPLEAERHTQLVDPISSDRLPVPK